MAEAQPVRGSAYRDYQDLKPLVTNGDVQRFLKDILKPFTEKVNIVEDGLLDALLASQVLTDIDNESLNALHHPTRTERARHLWKILHGIDHDVFIQKVLPVLCEKVGFIIPGKLFKTAASDLPTDGCSGQTARTGSTADKEKVCTRCAIVSRDRPEKLADFLYRIGMIDFKTHGDLTAKNRTSPTDWDKIFNSFRRLQRISASRHQKDMKQILSTDSLRVPDDLVDQMMKGFPCRCRSGKRPPSAKTLRARRMHMFAGVLANRRPSNDSVLSTESSVYPQSDSSSADADSVSLASENSTKTQHTVSEHGEGDFEARGSARLCPDAFLSNDSEDSQTGTLKSDGTSCPEVMSDSDQQRCIYLSQRARQRARRSILTSVCDGLFANAPPHTSGQVHPLEGPENLQGDRDPSVQCHGEQTQDPSQASEKHVLNDVTGTSPRESANPKPKDASGERYVTGRLADGGRISSKPEVEVNLDKSSKLDLGSADGMNASGVLSDILSQQHICEGTDAVGGENHQKLEDNVNSDCKDVRAGISFQGMCQCSETKRCQLHLESPMPSCDFENQGQCQQIEITEASKIEAAKQNSDLEDLCQFVSSDVTIEDLVALLKRPVVVDPVANQNLVGLTQDYIQLHQQYNGIRETTDEMLATLKSKTPIGLESPSPFLRLQEELTGICTLCENLLVLQRTFILCSVYLNMPPRVQTDRTREKTGTVVSDLLLLVEASLSGTLQKLETFSVLCLETTNLPGDFSEGLDVGIRKYLDGF